MMEGVIVGDSALELRYLNPLMIFHSFFSWWDYDTWDGNNGDMTGSFLSLELNWNIVTSLAFYGQFAMNQYATGFKKSKWTNQPPDGLGFLSGMRYSHSFKTWASVFYLEYLYTWPYLYMNPSPFASFIYMRSLGISPGRLQFFYTGLPRDTIALKMGTKFFKDDALSIEGDFTWVSQGKHTIAWDWEKNSTTFDERTPTGTVENKFIFSLAAQWKLYSFLVFGGGVTGIFSRNNGHDSGINETGGQAAFSVSFLF